MQWTILTAARTDDVIGAKLFKVSSANAMLTALKALDGNGYAFLGQADMAQWCGRCLHVTPSPT
jgi:hypothetical protein